MTVGESSPPASKTLDVDQLPVHLDDLFRAAYALCGSRHDAEDLVQETYARVLARPRQLRPGTELGYLMRALRNTWIDTMRSRAARPITTNGLDDVEFMATRNADPEAALQARAAYAAIAKLSVPLREAIVAVDILGLSHKQAARSLKAREGTIMSRVFRARQKVARELEGTIS
ncbi:MAG: hypothetical protein V7607_5457 [Solirubrobacteraceae bacterium]